MGQAVKDCHSYVTTKVEEEWALRGWVQRYKLLLRWPIGLLSWSGSADHDHMIIFCPSVFFLLFAEQCETHGVRKGEFQWLQRQESGADRLCGCWHFTPSPPSPQSLQPDQCTSHTPSTQQTNLLLFSSTKHNYKGNKMPISSHILNGFAQRGVVCFPKTNSLQSKYSSETITKAFSFYWVWPNRLTQSKCLRSRLV